jgi:hypothetical protein
VCFTQVDKFRLYNHINKERSSTIHIALAIVPTTMLVSSVRDTRQGEDTEESEDAEEEEDGDGII